MKFCNKPLKHIIGIRVFLMIILSVFGTSSVNSEELNKKSNQILDIGLAIQKAQQNDPWLVGNKHSQDVSGGDKLVH